MAACYLTKYIPLMERGGGLTMTAMDDHGIPCVTSKAGIPYPVQERQIRFHYEGIMNNLMYFGILDGEHTRKPLTKPSSHFVLL